MALGIPEYNPTLDREAMSFQRDLLGQLGANIQKNITTVITKNQLQGFAQGLQNVDPASPSFGRDLTGLLTQYPLAAQTPIAAAAINQLGAEYKFNQQQKMVETAFGRQLGLISARDYVEKQPYGSGPVTRGTLEDVASGRTPPTTAGEPSIPALSPATDPIVGDAPTGDERDYFAPTPQPVAPIDTLGSKMLDYRKKLIEQQVDPQTAQMLLREYGDALQAQERVNQSSTGSRVFETDAGGLVSVRNGEATAVELPAGTRIAPRRAGTVNDQRKAAIEQQAKARDEYRKATVTYQQLKGDFDTIRKQVAADPENATLKADMDKVFRKVRAVGEGLKAAEKLLSDANAEVKSFATGVVEPPLPEAQANGLMPEVVPTNPKPSSTGRMQYRGGQLIVP